MRLRIFSICFAFAVVLFAAGAASAQVEASTPSGRPQRKEELPQNIKETLAKQRIEQEKKDYQELLDRSEEAVKLSGELEKSFTGSNRLSSEDVKKLERLEKLVKKIRSELGADDDGGEQEVNEKSDKPSTMQNAFTTLQSSATQLFDEIKKSTRYSVSVVSIQTSNALLRLVKFIRFGK